jgi:DNA-binding beta-propeller fold protein YncE
VALFALPAAAQAEGRLVPSNCIGDQAFISACAAAPALVGVSQVAPSPDSRELYAVSMYENALTILDRDASGALTRRSQCFSSLGAHGCDTGEGLTGARTLALSPDGTSLYVGSAGGNLAVFDRAADGSLKQKPLPDGCFGAGGCQPAPGIDVPRSIAVSPDGATVYVASAQEISVFDRDADGSLVQKPGNNGCITRYVADGCMEAFGLSNVRDLVVSPDGKSVYVAAANSDAILKFDRLPNGTLSAGGCVTQDRTAGCTTADRVANASGLAVSPDGRNVYVASNPDGVVEPSGIAILNRDPATGALSQVRAPSIDGCVADADPRCRQGVGVAGTADVSLSPDGRTLYAATGGGIAVFDRAADGRLSQPALPDGCVSDYGFGGPAACLRTSGVAFSISIAVSPDGRSVYSASQNLGTVAAFAREVQSDVATAPVEALPGAQPQTSVVTRTDVVTRTVSKLAVSLSSHSVKAKRGKAFSVTYVSTAPGSATLDVLKSGRRVLSMKGSAAKRFKVTKKLAKGRYALKLTVLGADGQTASDSAKLTVRAG